MSMRCRTLVAKLFFLSLATGGCSGGEEIGPNASLALLVGDWEASRFVVTSTANPAQAPELVNDLGARFTLNVQPSGQYTAILAYQGTPVTEIGLLEVDGSDIVFHVSFPSPDENRSRFTVTSAKLTLDGPTEFDFNLDGKGDPATAHIELARK
jgi:hypothetical protein